MGGLAILLILLVLAGDEAPPPPWPPEPEPPLPPDEGGLIPAEMELPPEGEEPPFEAIIIPPVVPAEKVPPADGMTDAQWLAAVDALVSQAPRQGAFWQVTQGSTASGLASALLPSGTNTGSNRVRLIKCMTAVPWNRDHYAADAGRQTWGTLYDVEGVNLSPAWMPRHPSSMQALANRQDPPRGIDGQGNQVDSGGYYGMLWIPTFAATANALVCSGAGQTPPAWLMSRLQG